MQITDGVIIAAGFGKRLGMGLPKALVEVAGAPLLSRVLWTFSQLGLKRAVVVVGHRADEVMARFSHLVCTFGLDIEFVYNPRYEGGNGLSVLCAKGHVGERFVLSMVDHIFDPEALKGMLDVEERDIVIAVDSKPQLVDPEEATKVRLEGRRVVAIGKEVYPFDAIDCGIFVCTTAIFPAIESMSEDLEEWNDAKHILAKRGAALAYDIEGAFWLDVDTPEDLERAERLVKERFGYGLPRR